MTWQYLPIAPCPKPRQSRSDQWRRRPCVLRYRSFADTLRTLCAGRQVIWEATHVLFVVEMPRSWSARQRARMDRTPHRQRPDTDNFLKAFLDALTEDDAHIHDIRTTKIWGYEPGIYTREITVLDPDAIELAGPQRLALGPRKHLAELV